MNTEELRSRYLKLVCVELPNAARFDPRFPVREDHCFMRVVLDNLFGGYWQDFLNSKKSAYKQLSDDQLVRAISIAESLFDVGQLIELNKQSLILRGVLYSTKR
ncbi:hypothetical protein ACQ4M3_09725 [Leptolyngbya sp. AN03gr2]|uniref:hypothetical protein n=1 Tax=Leptolyngbya sp. AN03gr2 TaxID=3423364 RepID=UPI003D31D624